MFLKSYWVIFFFFQLHILGISVFKLLVIVYLLLSFYQAVLLYCDVMFFLFSLFCFKCFLQANVLHCRRFMFYMMGLGLDNTVRAIVNLIECLLVKKQYECSCILRFTGKYSHQEHRKRLCNIIFYHTNWKEARLHCKNIYCMSIQSYWQQVVKWCHIYPMTLLFSISSS